jgi:oxaloacetate decarboxylase alpha subunit
MEKNQKPFSVFPKGTGGTLELIDETLRDGVQSNWGMMLPHHMSEPVVKEMGEAGFYAIDMPINVANMVVATRFFKEDFRHTYAMWKDKLKGTKSNILMAGMGAALGITSQAENKTAVRMFQEQFKEWLPQVNQSLVIGCTQDEIQNTYPSLFPTFRALDIEMVPYLAIGHSPHHTDEFYAAQVKHLVETYKPISICLKDVDGLLFPERLRTLLAACQAVANGTPLALHMHGMNGLNTYNSVVAMQMGIRQFSTGTPPLANGSAHLNVFDMINNAEAMGIGHTMDVEKLNIIQERLTKAGAAFGHPVNNPHRPFELSCYSHQIPGGVISNTETQLAQLGISDKLQEVLEEIPRILEDMGHPIMITPFSQFIVTQAVLNIQMGRWEECLDSCVEFAAGIYGKVDSGVAYMDQNIKDKLLSLPQAKAIIKKADNLVDYINSEPSEAECKKAVGLSPDASREEYVIKYVLCEDNVMKNLTPGGPDNYKKYM